MMEDFEALTILFKVLRPGLSLPLITIPAAARAFVCNSSAFAALGALDALGTATSNRGFKAALRVSGSSGLS